MDIDFFGRGQDLAVVVGNQNGIIEYVQKATNYETARTTKLYDRTDDAISLDEIERILI